MALRIEHHLFPRVCSIHYPAISPIVEEVAAKYGIPYYSHPTLRASIASHVRMLRTLGAPPAAPASLTAEPATVKELDRQLTLNESILRTKVIRPTVPVAATAS